MTSPAFERALTFVLAWEGAYVDHPSDPGGATNLGVTQAVYDSWRRARGETPRSVRLITRAEAAAIYHTSYWLAVAGDQLPEALALATFDAAVHSGPARALAWQAASGGDHLALTLARLRFLTDLETWPVFGRGWSRRLADLMATTSALAATPAAGRITLYGPTGEIAADVLAPDDVLIRFARGRVHVRPDPLEVR